MALSNATRFSATRAMHSAVRVLAFILAGLASPALATTYTFTGPAYTFVNNFVAPCTAGNCANYTTAMHFGGSFTIGAPLAANLTNFNVRSQVISFSFNDGVNTYSSSDPNVRLLALEVSTDASGVPTGSGTFIEVQQWQSGTSPHATGNRFNAVSIDPNSDAVNDRACATVGISSGVADACTNFFGNQDSNSSEATASPPGSWVVTPGGPTTTTLTTSLNPSTAGQAVTFTATVAGSSPTGTVQFLDGASNLGSPMTLSASVATLTTSALTVGTHPITAVYGGDANNAGSTSNVVSQVVNAVIVPPGPQTAIPTLSGWALVLLIALVLALGIGIARGRVRR